MLSWTDKPQPRYERQLRDIEEIILNEANISKEKLYKVLEVLYEHRVIDWLDLSLVPINPVERFPTL